jgi:DNA helicase II / ATP-dependent DNA helicase PcrA
MRRNLHSLFALYRESYCLTNTLTEMEKTNGFQPSKYQKAVYEFITDGKGNAVVNAVAGSGKSTTIVEALKLIPAMMSVLFLAFNKAIVEELKQKIGNLPNATIRTLHSLGMSALSKVYKFVVDDAKYKKILTDMMQYGKVRPIEKLDEEETQVYKQNILKLVDLCRVNLCNNVSDLETVSDKYEIAVIDNEVEMALKVVTEGKGIISVIDFTDMIYLPIVRNVAVPKYDFVFIDECQDLSACQRELFLKALKPNGRFVSVGDPNQAIYGFAGADVESFKVLQKLPNTVNLPLSVCYRCDNSIIELAKKLVPQIEAKDNAPDGIVKYDCLLSEIADGDMILCRVNAPLVALCMRYIGQGVKAYVKGRDIGANLIGMIEKTKCRKIHDALVKIDKEAYKVIQKIMRKNKCDEQEARGNATYTNFQDKVQAIEVLSDGLEYSDDVCRRIESIFKDDQRNGICLSSVHKAKGLEANNVFIVMPEKFYNKYAMKIDWMAEQEANLVYVAYTRAKHFLGFVADKEMEFFSKGN